MTIAGYLQISLSTFCDGHFHADLVPSAAFVNGDPVPGNLEMKKKHELRQTAT
jgi:hypothetical protein